MTVQLLIENIERPQMDKLVVFFKKRKLTWIFFKQIKCIDGYGTHLSTFTVSA